MRMLPRLEAEEQLLSIEAARMGFGAYEAQVASEKVARLQAKAGGADATDRPKAKATPAQLGAMGIGVRQTPAKKALSDG